MLNTKTVPGSPSRFLLFCLLGIFGMLLLTNPAIAQDTIDQNTKEERIKKWRFGVYFSSRGLLMPIASDLQTGNWGGYFAPCCGDVQSPEDDVMPYPFFLVSIGYDKFQAIVGWNNDFYGDEGPHYNENIFKAVVRYNQRGKNLYGFGGLSFFHFNKKHSFTRYVCPATNDVFYDDCGGEDPIPMEVKTDRPEGKSITPGVNFGIGVEYKLLSLIWSHELEILYSPCKYKNFVCRGLDVILLGIHLE